MKGSYMKRVLCIFLALGMLLSSSVFAADINAAIKAIKDGSTVNVSATYMNTTDSAVPIWMFTGIYNADGTVKDVHIEGGLAQPNMYKEGTKAYSYTLSEGETARSFMWNKDTIYAYAPAGTAFPLVEKSDSLDNLTLTAPVMPDGYTIGTSPSDLTNTSERNKPCYYDVDGNYVGLINSVTPKTVGVVSTDSSDFTYTLTNGAWTTISSVNDALYVDQSLADKYTPGNIKAEFAPVSEGVVTISFDTKVTNFASHTTPLSFGSLYDSNGSCVINTSIGKSALYNFADGVSQTNNFAGPQLLTDTKSWHNIKYLVSFEERTVDMYIDDAIVGSYPFYSTSASDVSYIYFGGNNTSIPTSIYNRYYIDNVKITNVPVYDSVETAAGLSREAAGDMTTGQITQYDLDTVTAEEADDSGKAGFAGFGENSVATGKTTVTKNGEAGTARYISAAANLSEEAEEYGFVVNGAKYAARTELSKDGRYGIQLFNVKGGTDYTVKPYSIDKNGTTTYGTEYTTSYTGPDYSVENFTNFNLNAPDFSGYTQTAGANEWKDADGIAYTIDEIPVTVTPVTTESYFNYDINNTAYMITENEDGVLLVNGKNTPVKATASNILIEFEPVSTGKLEISYRYKLNDRQTGSSTYNFGLFMDSKSGIRAGGANMTQYGKVMIKTKRDSAAATNCTEITDVNGELGEAGALLADKDDFQWRTMKYIIDLDNKNYKVYFDGTYAGEFSFIVENVNGEVTASTVNALSFANVGNASSASSVTSNGYNFYLDDIKVIQLD